MMTNGSVNQPLPLLIAWEVTRTCNLNCRHCRAAARNEEYPNELTTEQCYRLLDNIASFAKPIIILTGGEPMLRNDIYDIAGYGNKLGMRMVMAPCGMLVDDQTVTKMIDSGIQCISISLDGATAESHDGFRRVPGAFATAIAATEAAKRHNLPFQINTTITRHNLDELSEIMNLAERLGAITFNPFLLVPTGRGKELAQQELSPQQYEQALHWLSEQDERTVMQLRVTCAPHYQRIIRQKRSEQARDIHKRWEQNQDSLKDRSEKRHSHQVAGCMGGKSFAFISHTGKVQICGFLEIEAGDVSQNGYDFKEIWNNSEYLCSIRDLDSYKGKCGYCEYRRLCGGCRARAYALTGDYLEAEPFCVYEPNKNNG